MAGRFAPIGVHLALLLIMVGGTLSASGSFRGSVTVPQGLNFVIGDVLGPSGFLSIPSASFNTEVHVNRFSMDYYDSGEVISCSHEDRMLNTLLLFFLVVVTESLVSLLFSFYGVRFLNFAVIFHSLTLTEKRL